MPDDKKLDDPNAAKAAADNAAAERAVAANQAAAAKTAGATEAATSIGDAVKRAVDAAVAAVQKVEPVAAQDFQFSGSVGGRFTLRGSGFSASGTVFINGHGAQTTEWGNNLVSGKMPADVQAGKVTVEVVNHKTQRGTFTL